MLAVTSTILLLLDHPTLKTAALLCLTIWSFCRLYYFAFYVIERYVDSSYRFSGFVRLARQSAGRYARWTSIDGLIVIDSKRSSGLKQLRRGQFPTLLFKN